MVWLRRLPEQPKRGSVLVYVLVDSADAQTQETVRGVVQGTDASVRIVLAGGEATLESLAAELGLPELERTVVGIVAQAGTTKAVNAAVRATSPCDLVLVDGGVTVAPGWLEGLRAAATSDSTIASATPMSLGVGGVRVLCEKDARPAAGPAAVDAAEELRSRSLRLHPRIATMGPGCVYVRRSAWDLGGPLRENVSLGQALQTMAARLLALGMVHVAADDVTIVGRETRRGAGDFEEEPVGSRRERELQATVACDERGPLRRSLDWGRAALNGISITIDGRSLTSAVGGTQTYVVGLVRALARERRGAVRVLVAPDLSPSARAAITDVPGVELLSYEEALRGAPRSDVVHRPQQVFTVDDLALLRLTGRRVVIGQQDLIAYHNYSYHPDVERWRAYRRTTRLALAGADQVVFFSEHARRDALSEDLMPEWRTHVAGIGWEPAPSPAPTSEPPAGLDAGERFLLCLGADYAHKNRPFAIELLDALRRRGFEGRLVLAGNHVQHGSSREREAELLRDPHRAARVLDLGPVGEATKQWLYGHALALLYPTVYEGFGLIPLEAAHADLPCLFAPQASLGELAWDAATLTPWDADASAAAVEQLLDDGPARDAHMRSLRRISVPTWQNIARDLVGVYEQALSAPPPQAAPRVWQELERENHIATLDRDVAKLKAVAEEYQSAYHRLQERVEFGLPLIDTGGLLSRRQQRGLMRVAARGRVGALALAPLGVLGRLGGEKKET